MMIYCRVSNKVRLFIHNIHTKNLLKKNNKVQSKNKLKNK